MSESKEEIIDFIIVVKYNGHNVRPNGSVDLNLISRYSEMVDSIRLLQLLNNDIVLTVKIPESKAFKLGSFRIGGVAFDHDGTAKIKFNGMTDFINTDNLNKLIPMDKEDMFQLKCTSIVELENEDDEEI